MFEEKIKNFLNKREVAMKKLGNLKYTLLLVLILSLVGCVPTVTIITPSDGAHFEAGEIIIFTGIAIDLTEEELSEDSLVWTSSIDEEIGTGLIVFSNNLSEGEHEITLTATDSLGLEGTATITITVG